MFFLSNLSVHYLFVGEKSHGNVKSLLIYSWGAPSRINKGCLTIRVPIQADESAKERRFLTFFVVVRQLLWFLSRVAPCWRAWIWTCQGGHVFLDEEGNPSTDRHFPDLWRVPGVRSPPDDLVVILQSCVSILAWQGSEWHLSSTMKSSMLIMSKLEWNLPQTPQLSFLFPTQNQKVEDFIMQQHSMVASEFPVHLQD